MRKLVRFALELLEREDGPTAVEYAVMMALIMVVCMSSVTALGSNAKTSFTSAGNAARAGS
jgi:pilus assembly protein Flp/PilA